MPGGRQLGAARGAHRPAQLVAEAGLHVHVLGVTEVGVVGRVDQDDLGLEVEDERVTGRIGGRQRHAVALLREEHVGLAPDVEAGDRAAAGADQRRRSRRRTRAPDLEAVEVGDALADVVLAEPALEEAPDVVELVPVAVEERHSLLQADAEVALALVEGGDAAVREVARAHCFLLPSRRCRPLFAVRPRVDVVDGGDRVRLDHDDRAQVERQEDVERSAGCAPRFCTTAVASSPGSGVAKTPTVAQRVPGVLAGADVADVVDARRPTCPSPASRARSAVSTVREPRSFGSSGLPRSLVKRTLRQNSLTRASQPVRRLTQIIEPGSVPGDPVQVRRVLDLVPLDRDRLVVAQVPAEPRGQVRQHPVVDRVDVVQVAQPVRAAAEVVEAGAEEVDEPPQLAVLGRGLRDGAGVARRPLRDVVAADDRRQQVVQHPAGAVHLGREWRRRGRRRGRRAGSASPTSS